jgi:nucleotide-binding universal stress UspA family protein
MHVLLAVDRSRDAKAAAKFLRFLQLPQGAKLSIMHVSEVPKVPPSFVSYASLSETSLAAAREQLAVEARRLVNDMAGLMEQPTLRIQTIVRDGLPQIEILDAIDRKKVDLAVLGTRGLSGLKRFLLGSLSEATLNYAECSVLIVRAPRRARGRGNVKGLNIVVGMDNSLEATKAATFMRRIGFPAGTRITLVHVVEKPMHLVQRLLPLGRPELQQTLAQVADVHKHAGEHFLEKARRQLLRTGLETRTILAEGDAADVLLRTTKRLSADLVVLGSRGLSGVRRIVLGSVSRRVARHAQCSVLIFRRPT